MPPLLYVGESVKQPLLCYKNNGAGSATLLGAIIETGPSVFSSTCANYGVPEKIPILEEHPQRPINPYGSSKLMVERMLADLGDAHGPRSIVLRYFNAAGADADGDIGEVHDPEPHLIPRVLAAARDGTAVTVYGDDYETADGACIRDYLASSKRVYQDLGFSLAWSSDDLAYFRHGDSSFLLQKIFTIKNTPTTL